MSKRSSDPSDIADGRYEINLGEFREAGRNAADRISRSEMPAAMDVIIRAVWDGFLARHAEIDQEREARNKKVTD